MPSHIRKPHVENLTDCLCTMSAVLSRVSWFATKIQFPDGWMVKFRGCSPEPSINSKGTFWHIWRIPSGCNPLGLRFRHQSLHLYHSISIPTAKSQPSAILSSSSCVSEAFQFQQAIFGDAETDQAVVATVRAVPGRYEWNIYECCVYHII